MNEEDEYVDSGEDEGGDGPRKATLDTGVAQKDAAEDEEDAAPDSRHN